MMMDRKIQGMFGRCKIVSDVSYSVKFKDNPVTFPIYFVFHGMRLARRQKNKPPKVNYFNGLAPQKNGGRDRD